LLLERISMFPVHTNLREGWQLPKPKPKGSSLWLLVLLLLPVLLTTSCKKSEETFGKLMTQGQGALEKGDSTNAIAFYSRAVEAAPESVDARLNLANAYPARGQQPGSGGTVRAGVGLGP
jgi:Tfp pilus assembly protein PilF